MEIEKETSANTALASESEIKPESEKRLVDLPRLEDLLRSEKEIKSAPKLNGLKRVENNTLEENKTFKSKEDEKNAIVRKRVKLVTGIYISVVALLLCFVGVNIATLTIMNRDINNNADTIQSQSEQIIDIYQDGLNEITDPDASIEVSLNPPRDYGDDKQELTFFDKLTILFKNLFG